MRFTLIYSGFLPSSRSRASKKHEIRCELHPQLQELWRTHPALTDNHNWIERPPVVDENSDDGCLLAEVDGHDFASLVHPELNLYAELDILLLRPTPPGGMISSAGDIDNQLKTLFDALRRPRDKSEIPESWRPGEEQSPLHCLVDDDKWVTRINVETDRLLRPGLESKDVEAIIRVTVRGFTATWGNIGLTG